MSRFKKLRAVLRDAIRRIAPKGGYFDTIFHSYDDWRELQDENRPKSEQVKPKPDPET
jgi:hypothetical protein